MKTTEKQKRAIREIVKTYFKNKQGEPFNLTDGQCDIFASVTNKSIKWLWVSAPSRYGKSEVLAMALILLAVFYKLKIPIVAGTEDKAKKIMEYILQHISDHPELYRGLINLKGIEDIQKLKVSASKDALRWATGGWIYVTSVDSRTLSREGEGVVGEGGDVVVLEEAGLIREKEQYSKVVRMTEGEWGKLIMSGNCIEKSVFENAYHDPMFDKVRIGLDQAIKEGRFKQEDIDQKRTQTTKKDWKRYYLVEFPDAMEFAYFKPQKYEYLPKGLEYYGSLDPALGESKNGSLSGITVIGKDENGQAYEVESIGEILTPDEAIRVIFNLPYKFQRFGLEAVQFQRYFLKVIDEKSKSEGRYIPFIGINQKRKKEERIESIEPAVNTGQVLFKGDNILWEHFQDYPDCPLDVLDSLEMTLRIAGITGHEQFIGFV